METIRVLVWAPPLEYLCNGGIEIERTALLNRRKAVLRRASNVVHMECSSRDVWNYYHGPADRAACIYPDSKHIARANKLFPWEWDSIWLPQRSRSRKAPWPRRRPLRLCPPHHFSTMTPIVHSPFFQHFDPPKVLLPLPISTFHPHPAHSNW